jgi:acetylornithine deacetylase
MPDRATQDQAAHQKIAAQVEASATRNVEFLRQLVSIPKPRMQEHQAVRFAADALQAAGCEIDVFAGLGIGEPTPAGKPINVLGCLRGTGGGRSVLLEAHLDTVPVGARDRWTFDPWGGQIVEDRIYARGAHDDVAGAALVCLVATTLAELGLKLNGDLHFLLTTEEEYSSGGMRALLARHPSLKPDAHMLVDGNGAPQECIVGHPGSVSFTIEIPGPFGTAQSPRYLHDGNPIEFAGDLFAALRGLERKLRDQPRDDTSGLRWPEPSIAIVAVNSMGWISNVPERCDVQVWGNVIPPMTIDEYRQAVAACVQEQAQARPWFQQHPPEIRWGPIDVPAWVMPMDSPFYAALGQAHTRSFGTTLVPRYIGGWGDMRLLGCPNAIFYGPGGGGNCHGYDEHYRVSDLNPMLRSLLYLCADWCGMTAR